jgi:hypothetical protein
MYTAKVYAILVTAVIDKSNSERDNDVMILAGYLTMLMILLQHIRNPI